MGKRLSFATSSRVLSAICLCLTPQLGAQVSTTRVSIARVTIQNIRFDEVRRLSAQQLRDIREEMRTTTEWPATQTFVILADSVREKVLAAYAENGYWRAKIEAVVIPQRLSDSGQDVDVIVRAADEGPQFRLRELQWSGVTAFSISELSSLVQLKPGDVMGRRRIAEGMESIRRVYASRGYINYSAVPEIRIDDSSASINLNVNVDEGGVFNFEKFDVIGSALGVRERLLHAWPLKRGEIYREDAVEKFLHANASLLPRGKQGDIVCRSLDLTNHTVEFVLDFRSVPVPCSFSDDQNTTRETLNRSVSAPQ